VKVCKIKSVKRISSKSHKYDLRIKDNHNYFANTILVHNCSLYNDYLHARSIGGQNHASRNWLKNFHSKMSYNIPIGWRICGENMYAKHTIFYNNLKSYFYVFSIWNEKNECLSWDETVEWVKLFNLTLVPVLYVGEWNEEKIKSICPDKLDGDKCEGYVVRLFKSFTYNNFRKSVAKYVKEEFIEKLKDESSHWRHKTIIPNILRI